MKKIIIGLLSANVLLQTWAAPVYAQTEEDINYTPAEDPGSDWQNDPILYPDTPDVTSEPEWIPPTTPAPTTPAITTPAPTYEEPVYEEPVYEEPVTEEPDTESVLETTEMSSEETTAEEAQVDDIQLVKDLVGSALDNPAYAMALEDYAHTSGEGYVYTNPLDETIVGSSMQEVQSQFETYLSEKEIAEEAQAEISKNATTDDLEDMQVLQYHYYYAGEPQGKETQVATLKFFFKEDQLFASSVQNHVPILTKEVAKETLDAINANEMTFESFVEARPVISGFVHKYVEGTETGIAVMAGKKEDTVDLHFVNLANETVAIMDQKQTQEKIAADQLMDSFITGKEPKPVEEKENKSLDTDKKDSENRKTTSESSEESTQVEETSQAEENQGQAMVDRVPVGFEYDGEKTVDLAQLEEGVVSLIETAEAKESVSLNQVQEWFGRPTVEEDGIYKYVAESSDKVIVANVEFGTESQEVTSIKIDQRTPELFEEFGLTVDDLFPIYENKESMVDQLQEKIGEFTIFEYVPSESSLRYLWTSFEDKDIQNIEVTKDLANDESELLYYEP